MKLLLIYLTLTFVFSYNCFGQKLEEGLEFVYNDPKRNSQMPVDFYLSNFSDEDFSKNLRAFGIFVFKIGRDGKVTDLIIDGDLPLNYIDSVKVRLYNSSKFWIVSGNYHPEKWIVQPAIFDLGCGPRSQPKKAPAIFDVIWELSNKEDLKDRGFYKTDSFIILRPLIRTCAF